MCLIALALECSARFPLVVAANRDEWFARPSAPLDWWRRAADAPRLLAGRDLGAGGTWLGLSEHGRVGALTNVRAPDRVRTDAPSRGALVTRWLEGHAWQAPAFSNPFNLLAGELPANAWWFASDAQQTPRAVEPGVVHGLSNATLGTPWPKVERLCERTGEAVAAAPDALALTDRLLAALADRSPAPDADLPDTGVGLARERLLSSAFIATPDASYGTRCSTVLVGEREGSTWRLRVVERSFDAHGRAVGDRAFTHTVSPG
jgi:uncharacterized protein with NRDE domain